MRHLAATVLCLFVPIQVLATPPSPSVSPAPTKERPRPREGRSLGLDVNNTPGGDYTKAFDEAVASGAGSITMCFDWIELEPEPGKPGAAASMLSIANTWYAPRQVPVHLMIRPLHTNQDVRPEALRGRRFDDPLVVSRFLALLSTVLGQVGALEIPSVSIGSEVDVWLGQHPEQWSAYIQLVRTAGAHLHRLRPGIKVAAEVTYSGIVGSSAGQIRRLMQAGEVLGVSHYPVDSRFQAQDPRVIREVFRKVHDFAGSRPAYFYQLGYPSSPRCGSSEARQAEFVHELFAAWDEHSRAIPMIRLTWMDDLTHEKVESYTRYYGFDHGEFREYLRTLGLRDAAGKPKQAWSVLGREAHARGW